MRIYIKRILRLFTAVVLLSVVYTALSGYIVLYMLPKFVVTGKGVATDKYVDRFNSKIENILEIKV